MIQKNIKVGLADDHRILRDGLRHIINRAKNMTVVAEGGSAAEAIAMCNNIALDVLVLEINLPDRSGMDVLKAIKERNNSIAVLILSGCSEEIYALRAFKAGASAYLTKGCTSADLVEAIQKLASGKKYVTPKVADVLASQLNDSQDKLPHESLSDRELQTLTLIASGFSVTEIAAKLLLSVKTISMYRSRLLEKMQMRHNTELIIYAVKNKLV